MRWDVEMRKKEGVMLSKVRCKIPFLVLLVTLFIGQSCGRAVSAVPSPAAFTATTPPDLIKSLQTVVTAIKTNQPEALRSLIGEEGVSITGFAQGAEFKGENNADEIIAAFDQALEQSTPVCEGFVTFLGALPDKAILVYRDLELDWGQFGLSRTNSNGMTIQLFNMSDGWRLVFITPFYYEKDLPVLGTLQPCPAVSAAVEATSTKFMNATPDDIATLKAIKTASIKTLISRVLPVVLATYLSGDGKWRAEVIRYDCINYPYPDYIAIIAYEQLKLINLRDGTEQIVKDQLQNCDGIGGGGLNGLYWSPNNQYFYYTDWREGNPESCGNYTVPMVYRFDTVTQESLTIGGGHISPDETKLAMWDRNEIVIWDLVRGEVGRVQSRERVRFNGEISWSPDGQSIVFLQTEWDCAPDYGKTYLTRLNVADLSQELLLEHEAPGFGWVSWDALNQLTLRDGNNKMWIYNLISKELKTAQ